MRKVAYGGAMSLDGFIAGPNGEYRLDRHGPGYRFRGDDGRFDTFLMGRKTFDAMRRMGNAARPRLESGASSARGPSGRRIAPAQRSAMMRNESWRTFGQPGKDIALFGGGELFRSLLAAGLVDEVSVSVIPVLLGGGFRCCRHQPRARG